MAEINYHNDDSLMDTSELQVYQLDEVADPNEFYEEDHLPSSYLNIVGKGITDSSSSFFDRFLDNPTHLAVLAGSFLLLGVTVLAGIVIVGNDSEDNTEVGNIAGAIDGEKLEVEDNEVDNPDFSNSISTSTSNSRKQIVRNNPRNTVKAKSDPTPVVDPDPEPKPDPTPVVDPDPEPEPKPDPKPDPDPDPDPNPDPKPDPDPDPDPDPNPDPKPDPDPADNQNVN